MNYCMPALFLFVKKKIYLELTPRPNGIHHSAMNAFLTVT